MVNKDSQIGKWAARGAVLELEDAVRRVSATFPHLIVTLSITERIKRRGDPAETSGPVDVAPTPARKSKRRRKMSAEGRARIAAAQKARWAKQKKDAARG